MRLALNSVQQTDDDQQHHDGEDDRDVAQPGRLRGYLNNRFRPKLKMPTSDSRTKVVWLAVGVITAAQFAIT